MLDSDNDGCITVDDNTQEVRVFFQWPWWPCMMALGDVDGNGLVDDGDGLGDVTIPIIKFGQLIWLLCTYCKYLPKPKTANLAKSWADESYNVLSLSIFHPESPKDRYCPPSNWAHARISSNSIGRKFPKAVLCNWTGAILHAPGPPGRSVILATKVLHDGSKRTAAPSKIPAVWYNFMRCRALPWTDYWSIGRERSENRRPQQLGLLNRREQSWEPCLCWPQWNYWTVSLYPGLPTPGFVACSTNTEEGLVKLITCNDIPGHWVDVWRSGTFPEKLQVSDCTTDSKHSQQNDWELNIRQSQQHFLSSESRFTALQEIYNTPPYMHPTSSMYTGDVME